MSIACFFSEAWTGLPCQDELDAINADFERQMRQAGASETEIKKRLAEQQKAEDQISKSNQNLPIDIFGGLLPSKLTVYSTAIIVILILGLVALILFELK